MKCRSFYLDLQLLEDYWVRRKYHHTMSSALVYALDEALALSKKKGSKRDGRATSGITAFLAGLARARISRSCRREGERLWTLNTVRVPDGVDEAAVRR